MFRVVDQLSKPRNTPHRTIHLPTSPDQAEEPLTGLLQQHGVVSLVGAVGVVVPPQLAKAGHTKETVTSTSLSTLLDCCLGIEEY